MSDEGFSEFLSRKAMYTEVEKMKTHDVLPASFFKDVYQMFDRNFLKKSRGEKLVKFTLYSTLEISTTFSRWLLNLYSEQKSMSVNLCDSLVHLPSFINIISNNVSLNLMKD